MCRHWRRTFLQHAALWSRLFLSKGEGYAKTLLERAKGSPLDIIANLTDHVGTMTLLPPHARQIKYINFTHNHWTDIQRFSEVNFGPLPLLDILQIDAVVEFDLDGPDVMTPPSLPLFSGATNLKHFTLCSEGSPFLNHFVFPNLTTFKLSTAPGENGFRVLELLNFLEASPTLQAVHMKIIAVVIRGGVPRERVVVLPNVETFYLVMIDGAPGYEIATHISCPSARNVSLMHETDPENLDPREIFPTSVVWSAIVRQYSSSPVEGVELEIKTLWDNIITSSLIFRSSNSATVRLGFKLSASDDDDSDDGLQIPLGDLACELFSQASRIIRDHPLLSSIKRLYIEHRPTASDSDHLKRMASDIGGLFKSVVSLDKLTFCGCDPLSYLTPLDLPEFHNMEQPVVFPPTKELTISHPLTVLSEEECMAAIVGLAKSQHAGGVPFERVTVCMEKLPATMGRMLEPWVGVADCHDEWDIEHE